MHRPHDRVFLSWLVAARRRTLCRGPFRLFPLRLQGLDRLILEETVKVTFDQVAAGVYEVRGSFSFARLSFTFRSDCGTVISCVWLSANYSLSFGCWNGSCFFSGFGSLRLCLG